MHAFYRDRLTRAFTGAGNKAPGTPAAANRATEPLQGDDVDLDSLGPRPLHLVCCAANDLSGDTIAHKSVAKPIVFVFISVLQRCN